MNAGVVSFDLDETLWEFMPMMDGASPGQSRAAPGGLADPVVSDPAERPD